MNLRLTLLPIIPLLLCMESAAQKSAPAAFYADAPDARIAVDVTPFHDSLWNLVRGWYGGRFNVNAGVCNNPPFSVTISDPPKLTVAGWYFPFDGRHGSDLGLSTKFYAHVDDSSPFCQENVTVDCSLSTAFDPSSLTQDTVKFPGECRVGAGIDHFRWPFLISLPLPWDSPAIPYVLQQPDSQPPNELHLEFGAFSSGSWVSGGVRKTIPVVARLGSVEPNIRKATPSERILSMRDPNPGWVPSIDNTSAGAVTNKYLVLDVSFGSHFRKISFKTFAEAKTAQSKVPIWETSQGLGLSVAPSLFSDPKSPTSEVGIFGNLLPIRIFGKQQYQLGGNRGMIGYELFITKSTAKFSPKPAGDITISFTAEKISAWIIRTDGSREEEHIKPSVTVKIQAVLESPSLSSNGVLAAKVKRFTLYLKTWVGNIPFELSRNDLSTVINNGLATLSQLRPTFALELPDCIDTSVDQITPQSPCTNPAQTVRFVKFMTPEKNRRFTLLVGQSKFRTNGGNLEIGIPMNVGPLLATPSRIHGHSLKSNPLNQRSKKQRM